MSLLKLCCPWETSTVTDQQTAHGHWMAIVQVLDNYLRQRAKQNGATVYNGLMMRMEQARHPPTLYCTPTTFSPGRLPGCLPCQSGDFLSPSKRLMMACACTFQSAWCLLCAAL